MPACTFICRPPETYGFTNLSNNRKAAQHHVEVERTGSFTALRRGRQGFFSTLGDNVFSGQPGRKGCIVIPGFQERLMP
jgi:hypothetical protein